MPITMSTLPSDSPAMISFDSAVEVNRESPRMVTGKPVMRSSKVDWCCWASSVVGTSTATWVH